MKFYKKTMKLIKRPSLFDDLKRIYAAFEYCKADPEQFSLKDMKFMNPVVRHYCNDLEGFKNYLKKITELITKDSAHFQNIKALYRKVESRLMNRRVRRIAGIELEAHEEKNGKVSDRNKWLAGKVSEIGNQRKRFLSIHREQSANKKLCAEERDHLLEIFWDVRLKAAKMGLICH